MFLDQIVSVIWTYSLFASIFGWALKNDHLMPAAFAFEADITFGGIVILGTICLVQFGFGIFFDSRYEKKTGRYYYWIIWYPLFYWVISVSAMAVGVPRALFRKKKHFETWESPDRGLTVMQSVQRRVNE
ncbi:MAG: hypothetical protein ACE5FU_02710 [Nitrospinota bacterium]